MSRLHTVCCSLSGGDYPVIAGIGECCRTSTPSLKALGCGRFDSRVIVKSCGSGLGGSRSERRHVVAFLPVKEADLRPDRAAPGTGRAQELRGWSCAPTESRWSYFRVLSHGSESSSALPETASTHRYSEHRVRAAAMTRRAFRAPKGPPKPPISTNSPVR